MALMLISRNYERTVVTNITYGYFMIKMFSFVLGKQFYAKRWIGGFWFHCITEVTNAVQNDSYNFLTINTRLSFIFIGKIIRYDL